MNKEGKPNDLESKATQRKTSKKRGKRLLTSLDMAEIKRLEAVHNAEFKRGEKPIYILE